MKYSYCMLQQELEEAAAQPDIKKEEEESAAAQQPKHQSLAQKIYAENRVTILMV